MMFGMFGLGWLMMLIVIGIPILLVILFVAGAAGFVQNRANSPSVYQNHPQVSQPAVYANPSATTATRYCSHCGAGLQTDWTHCPQCGAPIQ